MYKVLNKSYYFTFLFNATISTSPFYLTSHHFPELLQVKLSISTANLWYFWSRFFRTNTLTVAQPTVLKRSSEPLNHNPDITSFGKGTQEHAVWQKRTTHRQIDRQGAICEGPPGGRGTQNDDQNRITKPMFSFHLTAFHPKYLCFWSEKA